MALPTREQSPDGIERQMAVNHFAHAALVAGSLAHVRASAAAAGVRPRVVAVSSAGHRYADNAVFTAIGNLTSPTQASAAAAFESSAYSPLVAYGNSKLANVALAAGLARRHGEWLTALSLHPGVIITGLGRHIVPEWAEPLVPIVRTAARVVLKSLEQGAATNVYATLAPELDGFNGHYLFDCNVSPLDAEKAALIESETTVERFMLATEAVIGEKL